MLPLVLLGAVAAIAATAVAVYWKKIAAWLKAGYDLLPDSIKKQLQGFKTLVISAYNAFKNVVKYYSYNKETDKWQETIITKEVDESEIPEDILNKLKKKNEVDISQDVKEKLELAH